MRVLDFLSDSPRNYIFQKRAHKTNLGGFLFLLYCLLMIIIALSYILDFAFNDKFEVEYLKIENQTESKYFDALNENPNYNPTYNFRLVISEPLSDKFKVYYHKNGKNIIADFFNCYFLTIGKNGKCFALDSKVSDLALGVFYFCGNDSKCTYKEEGSTSSNPNIIYNLEVPFQKIEHQNKTKPISDDKIFNRNIQYLSNFKTTMNLFLDWRLIIYKEKKGISRLFDRLFDTKSEYFTGSYDMGEMNTLPSQIIYFRGNYYRSLFSVDSRNHHQFYELYKRKKITELDVLSSIISLIIPIRMVFIIVYRFYSKNFDNYKLIETLLSQSNTHNQDIRIKYKYETKERILKESAQENIDVNDLNISAPLFKVEKEDILSDEKEEKLNINNDNVIDDEFVLNEKNRYLPKLSFIQYFCNNLYCKKCKNSKKQEILEICNSISMKYMSVDSLMYNQMLLENLWKDYEWNNNSLNNIKNNELILKLKEFI